jgi:hypothetical protein
MFKNIFLGMVLISLVSAGCAKEQIYSSNPPIQTVSTPDYEVVLEPLKAEGYNYYNRFRCQFTSKSSGDLTIDWSETYYLRNGKRYGKFGWIGLTFDELRDISDQPDITIGPGKTDEAEIFPLQLIGWREEGVRLQATTPEAGFTNTPLPEGENGISLTVLKNGEVLRKSVLVKITME